MQPEDILGKFKLTFVSWQESLDHYSLNQLQKCPDAQSWSIGQLYMHLIDQTLRFNMAQIDICISGNDHAEAVKSAEGMEIFGQNSFPAIRLKLDAAVPKQPESVAEIREGFDQIDKRLTEIVPHIAANPFKGKTKHPGLGYLNAGEWLQLIEMHFRHHLHQKRRLDEFLNSS